MELEIQTAHTRQVIDITDEVAQRLPAATSLVHIFVRHTTCAVTSADLDPGTDEDLLDAVWAMLPKDGYRHPHNPAHAPAHLISSIIGPGLLVPVRNGSLLLGTWQRIVLVELDGPRRRQLSISIV